MAMSLSACYIIRLNEIERQWSIGRLYLYIIESRGFPKSIYDKNMAIGCAKESVVIIQIYLYSWEYPQ